MPMRDLKVAFRSMRCLCEIALLNLPRVLNAPARVVGFHTGMLELASFAGHSIICPAIISTSLAQKSLTV